MSSHLLKIASCCRVLLVVSALLLLSACSEQTSVEYETTIPALRVLVEDGLSNTHPSWHPDGRRLIYCAQGPGGSGKVELREVELTSKHVRTLASDSTGVWFPSWSPLDSTILCTSGRAGSQDLWLFTPADGGWRRLTALAGNESFPCWSPDGSRIAFLARGQIALLDTATNTIINIATPLLIPLSLSWGADGESLLFSADNASGEYLYRFVLSENRHEEIYSVPVLGSWPVSVRPALEVNQIHIAYRAMTPYGAAGIYFYRVNAPAPTLIVMRGAMPAWSPDGTELVYVSYSGSGSKLIWEKIWIDIDE